MDMLVDRPAPKVPVVTPTARVAARGLRLRFTWTIGIMFVGLNLLGIGAVLAIGYYEAARNTDALVLERVEDAIDSARDGLTSIVGPVAAQAREIAAAVRAGRIDPRDRAAMQSFMSGTLATTPQVVALEMVDTLLRFEPYVRYDQTGALEGLPATVAVARIVDWARDATEPRWVARWSTVLRQPILTLETPIHRPDGFHGVLISALTLADLSRQVSRIARNTGNPVFILYDRDTVVAHSLVTGFVPSPEQPLPTIVELGDPTLGGIWDPAGIAVAPEEMVADASGRRVETPDGPVTFVYRGRLGMSADSRYLVGTYYRGSLATAELMRLRDMLVAGSVVLALCIVLTILFGRQVSRPVRRLAAAATVIERQKFDAFEPLAPSTISEIDEASRAFNQMVDGLKERQRIRDLFGKYVPNEVVERLIAEPGALSLEGERREISLLFSDIAGFTTFAERMPPSDVLRLLNDYLEAVCATIHEHDGIIVDFIGDAVFAIFGAPVAREDHARRALACVRDMDRVASAFAAARNAEGIAFGATRIGVHTGAATVGNFGSRDRLKYSAAGDVVNTTSRLEGANKFFGTRLLASRLVVDAAGDRDWRPLGRLVLKGRSAELAVVECLAPDVAAQEWVAAYRHAYTLLEQGSGDAAAALRALAAARPDDDVVRFHLARVERGLASTVIELAEK
jgi:class 3 adenylate cyclase